MSRPRAAISTNFWQLTVILQNESHLGGCTGPECRMVSTKLNTELHGLLTCYFVSRYVINVTLIFKETSSSPESSPWHGSHPGPGDGHHLRGHHRRHRGGEHWGGGSGGRCGHQGYKSIEGLSQFFWLGFQGRFLLCRTRFNLEKTVLTKSYIQWKKDLSISHCSCQSNQLIKSKIKK